MKILLHVCCGPCTVYPLRKLRDQGHQVEGFFYNPNIHPYREFKRRISTLVDFAEQTRFSIEIDRNYGLTEYLRQVVFQEEKRCGICYDMRLNQAVKKAVEKGADAFSTTLLYSRYQLHELIRKKCEKLAQTFAIEFYYEDFRAGWQEGIDGSLAMGLYRQPYCGCIYSEQERYDKKLRKKIFKKNREVKGKSYD